MKKVKKKTKSQLKEFVIEVLNFGLIAVEVSKKTNLNVYHTPVVYDTEEFESFYDFLEYKMYEYGSVLDFKAFNPNLGDEVFQTILYEFLSYGSNFLVKV